MARDPTRGVLVISWLAGVAIFLNGLMPKVQDKFPAGAALLVALGAGPLLCFGLVFIEALLTALTGRVLGGRAGAVELRAAVAWGNAPLFLLLPMWGLTLALGAAMPAGTTDIIGVGLLVWTEVLAVILVAEVHAFSIGRAVGAIVLAWLIKIAIVIGIVVLLTAAERRDRPPEREGSEAAATVS